MKENRGEGALRGSDMCLGMLVVEELDLSRPPAARGGREEESSEEPFAFLADEDAVVSTELLPSEPPPVDLFAWC